MDALEDPPEVLGLLVVQQATVPTVLVEPGTAPVALHPALLAATTILIVTVCFFIVQVILGLEMGRFRNHDSK